MKGSVTARVDGPVVWITLSQPERRNAMTISMWKELTAVLENCQADLDVHVVIIRGEGTEAFSAGADISEFYETRHDIDAVRGYDAVVHQAIYAVEHLSALSIAMIYGDAVGGGAEIALATDWRFAATTIRMGITPAKLGIVYGAHETARLIDRVGASRALDLLATGRLVTGPDALQMRLIDWLVLANDLEAAVTEYIQLLEKNSRNAIWRMKAMIRHLADGLPCDHSDLDKLVYDAYASSDYHERVKAFMRKHHEV